MKLRSFVPAMLVPAALLGYAGLVVGQVDLSGTWQRDTQQDLINALPGAFPGDFMGIPLNAAGRAGANSYNARELDEPQRQCQPWLEHYIVQGPYNLHFAPLVLDPRTGNVVAWQQIGAWNDWLETTIWLDGRKPPSPLALHTFNGFTTGTWRGDTLVTTTTHIKDGQMTRNGVPSSNQEVLHMFITRHGDDSDRMTVTAIIDDPVYLTASYPLSQIYILNSRLWPDTPPMACEPGGLDPDLEDGYHSATTLPGQPDWLESRAYMKSNFNIPVEASQGGAETMYPEFKKELRGHYTPPTKYCSQYCLGFGPAPNAGRPRGSRQSP